MVLPEAIEEIIYRFLEKNIRTEELDILRKWLIEGKENQKEYEAICRTWYLGKYSGKWDRLCLQKAWDRIEQGIIHRRRKRKSWLSISVAASILLLSGVSIFIFREKNQEKQYAGKEMATILPGEAKAVLVLSSGGQIKLGQQSAGKLTENGVQINTDSSTITYQNPGEDMHEETVYNELLVPSGGEFCLRLADNSIVYLNSESKLRYPVIFNGEKREVFLEGEAYFEVASDSLHPFLVRTNEFTVNVLGTGFNVMAYRNDKQAEITLVHGKVNVSNGQEETVLKPNEQYVLNKKNLLSVVREVNAHIYTDWKDGILNFDALPLEQLAIKLSRWYKVRFVFHNKKLKELKFSGAVRKYDDIRYILSLIEATTEVKFEIQGNMITVQEKQF